MKKRIISLALSAITAVSAVSAMSANALHQFNSDDIELIERELGKCINIEDFEWIKYQGNTGAEEPFAVYVNYNENTSAAFIYHLSLMPDIIEFSIDSDVDVLEIEKILVSIDEKLDFSANTSLSSENKMRYCYIRSNEITTETAKKIREALADTAITFSFRNSQIRYQRFISDYLTSYVYSENTIKSELMEKLNDYFEKNNYEYELIDVTIGDTTPKGGIVNLPQTLIVPNMELSPTEHLKFAKDIYDATGLQPFMYHLETDSNSIANEIDMTDYLNGDANRDKTTTIADAAAIMQAIANPDKYALSDLGEFNADFACDGLTVDDAVAIQKKLAGIK